MSAYGRPGLSGEGDPKSRRNHLQRPHQPRPAILQDRDPRGVSLARVRVRHPHRAPSGQSEISVARREGAGGERPGNRHAAAGPSRPYRQAGLDRNRGAQPAGTIDPVEWETRVDLAACYRLVDHFGMTDLHLNHISARVPGSDEHFLINPFGMMYEEITASSLIKIDIAGNIIANANPEYGVNLAGYVIHGAIHAARHDVAC